MGGWRLSRRRRHGNLVGASDEGLHTLAPDCLSVLTGNTKLLDTESNLSIVGATALGQGHQRNTCDSPIADA
jgi:hypothetical protein